jgi:hypothetical protein
LGARVLAFLRKGAGVAGLSARVDGLAGMAFFGGFLVG